MGEWDIDALSFPSVTRAADVLLDVGDELGRLVEVGTRYSFLSDAPTYLFLMDQK